MLGLIGYDLTLHNYPPEQLFNKIEEKPFYTGEIRRDAVRCKSALEVASPVYPAAGCLAQLSWWCLVQCPHGPQGTADSASKCT